MDKLDSSCCRREPTRIDAHACDYYGNKSHHEKVEKVRLGGIYDPKQSKSKSSLTNLPTPANEPEVKDDSEAKYLERQQQCELSMRNFLKQPLRHPLALCRNETQSELAKKRLVDMERVQSATERVVEKFGGLTLGFTGSLPVTKISPKLIPNYPEELSMKRICKPRPHIKRRLRIWESEESEVEEGTVAASFRPQEKGDQKQDTGQINSPSPARSSQSQEIDDSTFLDGRLNGEFYKQSSRGQTQTDPSMPVSSDELILDYIEKHNLEMMFEYFLALCCLYVPDNPFQFISDVAGKMIRARDNEEEFKNLERFFSNDHVSAVFRVFDKEQNGFVTLTQYKTAMETLGLVRYNKQPTGHNDDKINEETFVTEGY